MKNRQCFRIERCEVVKCILLKRRNKFFWCTKHDVEIFNPKEAGCKYFKKESL